MRNARFLALAVTLVACSSGNDDNGAADGAAVDAADGDAAGTDASTDAPPATCVPDCGAHASCDGAVCACDDGYQGDGITCNKYWELVASYPFDIAPLPWSDFSPVQWPLAVGHKRSIFIGVQSHASATYPGWRSIDLAAAPPVLSPPLALPPTYNDSNELSTSGFRENVSSDGARYIYMFGNKAQRYDVMADRWFEPPGYGRPLSRGRGPQMFVPVDGTVQFFGGSGWGQFEILDTVLRYAIATNSYSLEPQPLPFPLRSAVAWLEPGGSTIYVAGGQHDWESNSTMPHNGIISRPTTMNAWTTTHPDAPGDLRFPVGMGDYEGRIWVAARDFQFVPNNVVSLPSHAYFFDPERDAWDHTIFLPPSTLAAVTADGATWALARTEENGVGGFDLYKLVAIDPPPEP
jgi:hypothetical protein